MDPHPQPLVSDPIPKVSMGCPILDGFLSGGIPSCSITELVSESGCGKTQITLQLLLNASPSLLLHTKPLPFPRLISLSPSPKNLSQIFVCRVRDPSHLLDLLSHAQIHLLPHRPISLIAIDSLADLFRSQFDLTLPDISSRTSLLFRVSSALRRVSHLHRLAILVTNHVVDDASGTIWSSGRRVSPALGIAWSNCINSRLFLTRDDPLGNARKMTVVFAPHLPVSSCSFKIDRKGVFGISEHSIEKGVFRI